MEDIRVRRVVQTEDLSNVEFETSEDVEVLPTFDSMGLREELLRGIYAYGKYLKSKYPLVILHVFELVCSSLIRLGPRFSVLVDYF